MFQTFNSENVMAKTVLFKDAEANHWPRVLELQLPAVRVRRPGGPPRGSMKHLPLQGGPARAHQRRASACVLLGVQLNLCSRVHSGHTPGAMRER